MKPILVSIILLTSFVFTSCKDKKTEIATVVPEVNVVAVGTKRYRCI